MATNEQEVNKLLRELREEKISFMEKMSSLTIDINQKFTESAKKIRDFYVENGNDEKLLEEKATFLIKENRQIVGELFTYCIMFDEKSEYKEISNAIKNIIKIGLKSLNKDAPDDEVREMSHQVAYVINSGLKTIDKDFEEDKKRKGFSIVK